MTWVSFRELREKLDFREVLRDYKVEVRARNRVQHTGPCPLPGHEGHRRSPSFSAHLDKRIWRCFGCGAQGNIIDFACRMEGLDPANSDHIRRVALILSDRYGITSEKPKRSLTRKSGPTNSGIAVVNAPLDFALKVLDPHHPCFRSRGLSAATIEHFELGFASRGLMQGRIAIPLRNSDGELIGYAGRIVDESRISDENPEYRFPSLREHEGKRYEFDKSKFLYNAHAIAAPVEELTIVSYFPSVWWLWQHGYRDTVALMGSSCSPEQAELIVGMVPRNGRIRIFTDGTKVGTHCGDEVLRLVTPYRFCRWISPREGKNPTDCSKGQLDELFR